MLTLGMLSAGVVDWLLNATAGPGAWRWMVGLPAAPGGCCSWVFDIAKHAVLMWRGIIGDCLALDGGAACSTRWV
jgi:hypothetical protein